MSSLLIFLVIVSASSFSSDASVAKSFCKDPYYGRCYGIPQTCPPGCPKLCEVDCSICKPFCACDRPGAVCQDPRFIGGDGIMFYFHGRRDKDFCLITDPDLHINAHFIGKRSNKGRDFTWVQSIGILFSRHRLYISATRVATWNSSADNIGIQFDGTDVTIPPGEGEMWWSADAGLRISRAEDVNLVMVEAAGLFKMKARVVPISHEESRVHGYDITDEDCFAHLELGFKFSSLSAGVDGILGQTYALGYHSRVKMGVPMPIMGGAEKFATSHVFSTDCKVSKFGQRREGFELEDPPEVVCVGRDKMGGIVCKR